MKIMIIGADGQLGTDLRKVIPPAEQIPLTIKDLDITDQERVLAAVKRYAPAVVINTAAYHNVNEAEVNKEAAFAVNAEGVKNIAEACRETGAALVHISTDYVFDGEKGRPYVETDEPNPLSQYGRSKLQGEKYVQEIMERHWLVRTTGLYGAAGCLGKGGGNFVETIYQKDEAFVVDDERLSPTYTLDLAVKLNQLIRTKGYGTFHIVNQGDCTWFEFAREIFELVGRDPQKVKPWKNSDPLAKPQGVIAKRPKYSVLKNAHLKELGLDDLRPWREALRAYLLEKGYLAK
jgi:dTDP-4-dehydrorhamnose reductase